MTPRARSLLVARDAPIRDVMRVIDGGGIGIALVVRDGDRFVGTVTDGDVRRAVLAGLDLELPVSRILALRSDRYRRSITALAGTPDDELLRIMLEYEIRHVPVLDDDGHVVDVAFVADLVREHRLPVRAVVMAGGYGKRLRPLTKDVPKPMLPVGGRPLLETTLDRLRRAGIQHCTVTTHYLGDRIRAHFGDGTDLGIRLGYVEEESPMGTAGALRHVVAEGESAGEPLLLMNGDVLTGVDFEALLTFHREQSAKITIGVRPYEVAVPFGVVTTDGPTVTSIEEKPVLRRFINAGIYLIEPQLVDLMPTNGAFDMPDLLRLALDQGHVVAGYPITEYWQDIGSADDYRKAIEDWDRGLVETTSEARAR